MLLKVRKNRKKMSKARMVGKGGKKKRRASIQENDEREKEEVKGKRSCSNLRKKRTGIKNGKHGFLEPRKKGGKGPKRALCTGLCPDHAEGKRGKKSPKEG